MIAKAAADAAQRIASLDFTTDNLRIAELEKQIAELDTAIERGVARNTEIGALLSGRVKVDAGTAADALLDADADTTLLSPNADLLASERESLLEGLRELRHRREDVAQTLAAVKRDAKHRAGNEVEALLATLTETAEAASEVLIGLYGTAKALNYAVDDHALRSLEDKLGFAVDGLVGQRRVIEHRAIIEVPADIVQAFRSVPKQAPAFAMHIADSVSLPVTRSFLQ